MKFIQAMSGITLAIASIFATTAHAQEKVIGIVAIDLQSSFFVRMKEAGDVAAKDYGVTTSWQSAEGSLEKQVSLIENLISQKASAILVDPLDKNALIPVLKKAQEAGISVITMGNKVEAGENYSTLYPDEPDAAQTARALARSIGGEGEVAALIGARGNYVSDTREKGFTETIAKEFPNVKIVAIQPAGWDPSKGADVAQTWVSTYPDLKGIWSMSDTQLLGASSIAQAAGRSLKYAGFDGDAEMGGLFGDGSMVIDVLTGAYRVGYWNIAVAARLAKGEKLPKDLYMPTYLVMTDAMAQTVNATGDKINYVTPEKSQELAKDYSKEFGPSKDTSAMSVGQ
ncbi:sugar ABC transporter substrate-binding protein [Rhizobium lusitanum]|uniref:sugar ABC transporter substrate-binding protein n=2 Tax=Rhizobium TaxID=379 RepID=UPI00195A71D1|nr:sugar ABC transporter substrate-binding protein [Rhizobium lusitanum]MBM7044090.1 sugar ABC transporter substrate-binding protein [Rhizobium lusitanum]